MKAGILTYYGVHNHGAVLQAYALSKVLSLMGQEVEFLTYKRNYDNIPLGYEKKYSFGLSSVKFYLNYLAEKGIMPVIYNYNKGRILNKFRKRNFRMGDRYTDTDVDIVFIGSDEVFSIEIGINPFFYGHGVPSCTIFSYAGSFGPTTMGDIESLRLRGLISSGLQGLDGVGVRDYNSYKIARELTDKEPTIVCDPVILYGYKEEMQQRIDIRERFLLVYAYDKNMNSDEEVKNIREFADARGLKVYSVGYYHKWCDRNVNPSPFEMLAWIKKAEFVVTDTFHGAVMSLICNTQFCVKLRGNTSKLRYLMEEYGQTGRITKEFDNLDVLYSESIDFKIVNNIIDKRRAVSYDFIEDCLRRSKV